MVAQNTHHIITQAIEDALAALGLRAPALPMHYFGTMHKNLVIVSKRQDLSHYQSNVAMRVAGAGGENPSGDARVADQKRLAAEIANVLRKDSRLKDIEVFVDERDAPGNGKGIINFKGIRSQLLERNRRKMIMDFGGANIGKKMHIGHIRTLVNGQAMYNLARVLHHDAISDSHLGDWGLQMGQIISQLEEDYPDWPVFQPDFEGKFSIPLTMDELNAVYPNASNRYKSKLPWNGQFQQKCREATAKLQSGEHAGYRALWESFRRMSVDTLRDSIYELGVSFDYWGGESDVNSEIEDMIEELRARGLVQESGGALIIDVERDGDGMPPLILKTSAGAATYAATDLATIRKRIREENPDIIQYYVDSRQALHFRQVFRAAAIAGYDVAMEHIELGTYNGSDGKPLKTREGVAVELQEVLDVVKQQVRDNTTTVEEHVTQVAASALIFNELLKNRMTDTIFLQDERDMIDFSTKSALYLHEIYGRIDQLLAQPRKRSHNATPQPGERALEAQEKLVTLLEQRQLFMERAFDERSPHILAEYLYDLARAYDATLSWYAGSQNRFRALVAPEHLCALAEETRDAMKACGDVLGIRLVTDLKRKTQQHVIDEEELINNINVRLKTCEQRATKAATPVTRPEIMPLSEAEFEGFVARCNRFADSLRKNRQEIIKALSVYEPAATAEDEIDLALRCLQDVRNYRRNFTGKVPQISALLHANLPIYYYVVLAVLPSAMTERLYLRPNQHMQDKNLMQALAEAGVDFDQFPNVTILDKASRKEFYEGPVADSDFVIVNGDHAAARNTIVKYMKENATLVSEGRHHDPFVVTETADIGHAVERAMHLKSYNSGQECAAPDAILVDRKIADEFIRRFTQAFARQKCAMTYNDPEVMFGPPIAGKEDIERARSNGAAIDDSQGLIKPTVITSHLSDSGHEGRRYFLQHMAADGERLVCEPYPLRPAANPNLEEMFSPLQFIHVYDGPEDLARYFDDPRYAVNKGYVSLFCNETAEDAVRDGLLSRNDDSLPPQERDQKGIGRVIVNKTIHNLLQDEPYAPFGACSEASFVMRVEAGDNGEKSVRTSCEPIAHTDIINRYVIQGQPVPVAGVRTPDVEKTIPDLTAIAPGHAILKKVQLAVASPATLDEEPGRLHADPMDAVLVLDVEKFPSKAELAEAERHVRKALENYSVGKVTFISAKYLYGHLEHFTRTPAEVGRALAAFAHPEANVFLSSAPKINIMAFDEMARGTLARWREEINEMLPGPVLSRSRQLSDRSVVAAAYASASRSAVLDDPIIPLSDSRYYLSLVTEADYDQLLDIAKKENFHFAPLNALRGENGQRMPLEGDGGSVRNYLGSVTERDQRGARRNFPLAVRDREQNGKLAGVMEILSLAPGKKGSEAEIGLFVNPDYRGELPMRNILIRGFRWAQRHLDLRSVYATVDPQDRGKLHLLATAKAQLDPELTMRIEKDLPYLSPEGEPALRIGLRISELGKVLDREREGAAVAA